MTHGGAPAGWLEFSASLNPAGVPAAVAAAVAAAPYAAYADLDPEAAAAHLARDAGVAPESLLLTAGATEAIRLIGEARIARGPTVIVGPTYSEYARSARLRGSSVELEDAGPPSFDPPVERALARLGGGPGALIVCDPNNPTGRAIEPERLRRVARSVPAGATLVIDQSFGPFAPPTMAAAELLAAGNVVLVRSLTKVLATPGLRLGYVIARPATISALRSRQDPWSIGAHAVAAALVASWTLSADARAKVIEWRERMASALGARGLDTVASDANFLLVRVGSGAAILAGALAERRIAVRPCASFGLPDHIRLAVRPPAEQDVLLEALDGVRVPAMR